MAAVEELKNSTSPKTALLKDLLSKAKYDLEKGLIRIYYGKASRSELLTIMQSLMKVASAFPPIEDVSQAGYTSSILNECLAVLPRINDDVQEYLSRFNYGAAQKDDKYNFFRETEDYETITDHKLGIAAVEHDLQEHLTEAAVAVKKKQLEYMTVSGIDYLLEIENANIKNVPATWIKISGTKKVSRFHTPQVVNMIRERDQRKESLAAECDRLFKEFLLQIAAKYQQFRDVVQSLATLDCLISLATLASQPGYVKPSFTNDTCIVVQQGRHPMVEQLLLDAYVPNDVELVSTKNRTVLLTGPNMGK